MKKKAKIKRFSLGLVLIGMCLTGWASSLKPQVKDVKSPLISSVDSDSVWVMRPDEALSCDPQSGVSLLQGADQLKAGHIPVLDSRKGSDGRFHAQMCGASTGSTNSFLIPRAKLPDAIALGYREVNGQAELKAK